MAEIGSNSGLVPVMLTADQRDFLVKNCDSNLALGMQLLNGVSSEDKARMVVDMLENFKAIKKACIDAG